MTLPVFDPGQVCPYLGRFDDPATHYESPSSAHRCHATGRPDKVDEPKQARDCLTAQHVTCPRYHPPDAPPPPGRLLRGAMVRPLAPAFRLPGGAAPVSRARRARRLVALVLLAAVVVGAAGIGLLQLASQPAAEASSGAPGTTAPGTAAPGAGGSTP